MSKHLPLDICCHPDAQLYVDIRALTLPEGVPVRSHPLQSDSFQLIQKDGLALQPLELGNINPLTIDFVKGKLAHRRQFGGGRKQDIARACGLHQNPDLFILDATAGLGRDAFVLASLGARVSMVERNPFLYLLLQDALYRADQARVDDPALSQIVTRLGLQVGDAREMSDMPAEVPDVVYLDPMFPPRTKSAKVKADMQALHRLVGSDDNADLMLDWARTKAHRRVVVKRPRHAPELAGRTADHQLVGKANRFDVYTIRRLTD